MRPGFITGTLVALIVVLQLVSLVALSQATQTQLLDQAKQSALHGLDIKAKRLVNQAQQFLTPISSQLMFTRQLIADDLLNTLDDAELELYFLSQLRSNTSINAMYLGRFDGSFVAVARFEQSLLEHYRKPVLRAKLVTLGSGTRSIVWREYSLIGELLSQWSDDDDKHDPRVRDWYFNALEHDLPVWTNAFSLTGSRKLAIAASVNLRDNKKFDAGVLGVSIELSTLSALVSGVATHQSDVAVILDRNYREIAASFPADSLVKGQHPLVFEAQIPFLNTLPDSDQRSLASNIDGAVETLDSDTQKWFSDDGREANLQREISLFNGALQWNVILQTRVVEIDQAHKALILDGMYRSMSIVVVPGLLSLLVIFGLREPLRRLHRSATIDFLTRALNREEFLNRFAKRLFNARSQHHNNIRWIAVVMDLDGFKQINDNYGHDAGDIILQAVVSRLQQRLGRAGFVGRLGGDEFAVALRLQPHVDAQQAVEAIRQAVVRQPVDTAHAVHHIGMTAGVAEARDKESVESLLERADGALVSGKLVGKNTTYIYSHTPRTVHPRPIAAVVTSRLAHQES